MTSRHFTDEQQVLTDMARQASDNRRETTALVQPGSGIDVRPVIVKAHVSYNVYQVRAVVIGDAGSIPAEMGELLEATNLAEPYWTAGTLAADTFAITFRLGQTYVFYAMP